MTYNTEHLRLFSVSLYIFLFCSVSHFGACFYSLIFHPKRRWTLINLYNIGMCVCTAVRLCAYVCECVYFSTLKPSHLYLIRTQYSYCEIVGRSVFHSMPFAVILDFFFLVYCIAFVRFTLCHAAYVCIFTIYIHIIFFLPLLVFVVVVVILLHFSCSCVRFYQPSINDSFAVSIMYCGQWLFSNFIRYTG